MSIPPEKDIMCGIVWVLDIVLIRVGQGTVARCGRLITERITALTLPLLSAREGTVDTREDTVEGDIRHAGGCAGSTARWRGRGGGFVRTALGGSR